MPWDFLLILAVLGVAVPWRGAVRMRQLLAREQLSSAERLALYASTIAFQWLATFVVFWRCWVHHVSAANLALTIERPWLTIFVSLALASLLTANQAVSVRRMAKLPPERRGFLGILARKVMPQNTVECLVFVALVVTIAVCEEFLYRGFIQGVFQNLFTGSIVAGLVISSLFFSTAHLYQGRRGLLTTFLAGLVFSGVRAWTGSLLPSILAHFSADLTAGLFAPHLFRRSDQESHVARIPREASLPSLSRKDPA